MSEMSQKKKLVLSPLPEQTVDYSRYEESETRWDRIIAVFVVLAVLMGVLIYFLVGNDDEGNASNVLNTTLTEEQLPALGSEKISTYETKSADVLMQDTEKEQVGSEQKNIEQAAVNVSKSEEDAIEKTAKPETKQTATEDFNASKEPERIATEASGKDVTSTPSARIVIENDGITRALLTQEIKDQEPQGSIPFELALPDEGIVKVILFTEMHGLRGKKLYHEWYRNGVRQARVRVPVNVNKQRSHSSKYINTQMLGDWQVKVLDGKQNSYALAEFKVVLP
tara:strand:+ start:4311 stop:5156 length:846 start_codon:yes stop_codon:yes gene_type:complete